ncbi:MAG: 2-iminoacetate synthase ThiH [Deltaproteobacteria bacterium]|nr:2-iminoacetate synthase ThiH [Deltaproteobacteria bacterium]
MGFYDVIRGYRWEEVAREIENRTRGDVERALAARSPSLDDLLSLVSPAADPFLEEMAQRAHRLTVQRFGRVVQLFAPLYLSNVCTNRCVYCGFNAGNRIARLTLTPEEAAGEGEAIRALGFRHLLLLAGEAPAVVTLDYFKRVLEKIRSRFSSLGIELFPMETKDYRELIDHGVDGMTLFQETYDEGSYGLFHPAGRKSDYRWRLETTDRAGEAGFRRIGLGALLGLNDWRVEGFFLALHADHLQRIWWRSQVAVSFPRLRPAPGGYAPRFPVTDRHLVQLLCALRLFLPDAGFTLSTRELPALRDSLLPLGITLMSAGSHTEPGGYAGASKGDAQFRISDDRSPAAVAETLRLMGYEPVWKDWDAALAG